LNRLSAPAPGSAPELSQLLSGFCMLKLCGLVSCRCRVQAFRLLRFPLTEVVRSSPNSLAPLRLFPGSLWWDRPSLVTAGFQQLPTPLWNTPVKKRLSRLPTSLRRAWRSTWDTGRRSARIPEWRGLLSPADYGVPFKQQQPKPLCLPVVLG